MPTRRTLNSSKVKSSRRRVESHALIDVRSADDRLRPLSNCAKSKHLADVHGTCKPTKLRLSYTHGVCETSANSHAGEVTGYRFTGLTSLNITLMISDNITSYSSKTMSLCEHMIIFQEKASL